MMFHWKSWLVVGLTCLAAGPMAPPLLASNQAACAQVRLINNFRHIDANTAIFEAGAARNYRVTFQGLCRDLKWAFAVRVEARRGACLRPGDIVVVSRDGLIPDRCIVKSVEALSAS